MATWEALGRFDASTEWGCGGWLWIRGAKSALAFMHKWTPAEREKAVVVSRESTTVLEAMAMEMWMRAFGALCKGLRVLVEGDNENVARAVARAYSSRPLVMACIHGICDSAARHSICLRSRVVLGDVFNKIADHLSHHRWEEALCVAREELGVPLCHLR
jgi:hypothetical protein